AGFSSGDPWEALSDDPGTVNVATESADPASLLSSYRDLIRLRFAHPALSHGDWIALKASSSAINAYLRSADGETVLVVANLGDTPARAPALQLAAGPLCGNPTAETLVGPKSVRAPTI